MYLIYVCLFFNRTGAVKAMIKTVYPSNHRILTLNGEMHMEFSFNMKPYSLYIRTYQYLQFCNLRWDQRMIPLYHIHIYIPDIYEHISFANYPAAVNSHLLIPQHLCNR